MSCIFTSTQRQSLAKKNKNKKTFHGARLDIVLDGLGQYIAMMHNHR
jgi:polysaccharide deacetylase 2 family uncharacterized protein YibQ